jgi:hypothetical protein
VALTEEEYAVFAAALAGPTPNFERREHHLVVATSLENIATARSIKATDVSALLRATRVKLLALRAGRVRPERDEKFHQLERIGDSRAGHRSRVLGRDDLALAAAEHSTSAYASLAQRSAACHQRRRRGND